MTDIVSVTRGSSPLVLSMPHPGTGLPAEVAAQLNAVLNQACGDPVFAQRLADVGLAVRPMTIEAFGEFIKRDAARWAELVKSSGAKAE